MNSTTRRFRRPAIVLGLCVGGRVLVHLAVVHLIDELAFGHQLIIGEARAEATALAEDDADPEHFAELAPSRPMLEIDPFDDEAKSWSTVSGLGHSGVTVFDANGDGLPDVYFCQDGLNWTRASDAEGVLDDGPRHQRNVLYLHQGLDDAGQPIYRRLDDLARDNTTYVREELLVENFFRPRRSSDDSFERPGRQSVVAVAADFNADGRIESLSRYLLSFSLRSANLLK